MGWAVDNYGRESTADDVNQITNSVSTGGPIGNIKFKPVSKPKTANKENVTKTSELIPAKNYSRKKSYRVAKGLIPEDMIIENTGQNTVEVILEADSVIMDDDDKYYEGDIFAVSVNSADGKIIPKNKKQLGAFYEIGSADYNRLSFDKPAIIKFYIGFPVNNPENVKAYYYDEKKSEWKMAGDGGELTQDQNGKLIWVVKVDHFTLFTLFEDSGGIPFLDMIGHWAEEFVKDLYIMKIVNGYDEEHYGPDNPITRAELIKIALNSFGVKPLDISAFEIMSFLDVKPSAWYAPFIQIAYAARFIDGYQDNTFKPDRPITRGEALKLLSAAMGTDIQILPSYNANFADVPAGKWYSKYVNYFAEKGIIMGYGDGKFRPEQNITRAEIAKIVSMLLSENLALIGQYEMMKKQRDL